MIARGHGVRVGLWLLIAACASALTYAETAEEEELTEIVITGSLLPATSMSAAPVTVLSRRDLERGNADSLAEVLQSLPMVTGTADNTDVDGSFGAARVNMRGLGPDRTLVLLNGRRLPNGGLGGDASVDLNSLPMSMIERVEVLASGASAIYGSDAIGGVVNVVTRKPGGPANIGGSLQVTDQGGGQVARADAAYSIALAGGAWDIGVDLVRQNGVTDDRRAYSAQPLRIIDANGDLGYAGQLGIPDGEFEVPAGNALGLAPGAYVRKPGSVGQQASDYRPFTREDTYNVAPYNYSQSPSDRSSLWLLGEQPLSAQTQLFVEGLFNHRESNQNAAPPQYVTIFYPSPTLADGSNGIPANNYYNPFGVDLPSAARRFGEVAPRIVAEDINVWRVLTGLKGDRGRWHWEVTGAIARSDSTTRSSNFFASSRYPDALGPSGPDSAGQIVCGTPDALTGVVPAANVIAGCVPLDIFNGAGSVTPPQITYMAPRPIVDNGTNEQSLMQAVLRGPAGKLWHQELNWAFGADYRRESGALIGDPLEALNFEGPVTPDLPGGAFDTSELFGELQLPWSQAQAGGGSYLDLGVRLSHYSTFGYHASWSAGIAWQATVSLRLRANYATVFRAPELEDLYQTRTVGSDYALDPCGNQPTPAQQVHCAANGVPGGAYVQPPDEFATISGGNPALQPEEGNTTGLGAIYTPHWAEGLQLSVDYFRILLNGVVSPADLDVTLADCANHGSPISCGAIRRLADGSIVWVATLNENLGERVVDGLDFAVNWNRRVGGSTFAAQVQATYLRRWDETPYPGGATLHQAGRTDAGPLPHWRAIAHLDFRHDRWLIGYSAEYIGDMTEQVEDFPPLGIFFPPYQRRVPSVVYQDLEAGYHFANRISLLAAITNVGNKDPPFLNTGLPENTDPGTYRLLGRSYSLMLNRQF
jgi:outer membrane receptor protein involved in Fe transport